MNVIRISGLAALAVSGMLNAQVCQPAFIPEPLPALNLPIAALTRFDDGSGGGPATYVGGLFTTSSNGQVLNHIARIGPGGFEPIGSGLPEEVWSLAVFADQPGLPPALWSGGEFGVRRWDGLAWTEPAPVPGNRWVMTLSVLDLGDGPRLYAGSRRASAASPLVVVRLDGPDGGGWRWTIVGPEPGQPGAIGGGLISGLLAFDPDGIGPEPSNLFAVGSLSPPAPPRQFPPLPLPTSGIARWRGGEWLPVPGGFNFGWVKTAAVFDDGAGPAIYLSFHPISNPPSGAAQTSSARWDGISWKFLPTAAGTQPPSAFATADLGNGLGERLYASTSQGLLSQGPEDFLPAVPGTPRFSTANSTDFRAPLLSYLDPATHTPTLIMNDNTNRSLMRLVGCPRCPADFDADGVVGVGDLFGFLQAYFTRSMRADYDASGLLTVEDVLLFLGSYLAGCH